MLTGDMLGRGSGGHCVLEGPFCEQEPTLIWATSPRHQAVSPSGKGVVCASVWRAKAPVPPSWQAWGRHQERWSGMRRKSGAVRSS